MANAGSGNSEYDDAMPSVQDYLEKFMMALERVRASHDGRPIDEVRAALVMALDAAGVEAWSEVVEDAASMVFWRGKHEERGTHGSSHDLGSAGATLAEAFVLAEDIEFEPGRPAGSVRPVD